MHISLVPFGQELAQNQSLDEHTTGTRQGEDDKFWFRSNRFFAVADQWYFTTREKIDVGPFGTREAASHGLELFIECIEKQGSTVEHAAAIAKQGDWAIVGFH